MLLAYLSRRLRTRCQRRWVGRDATHETWSGADLDRKLGAQSARNAQPRSVLVDEAHARSGVNVAVLHLLPARAAPREVHLADQEPVAARMYGDDAAKVAAAARALHTTREAHDGARTRRGSVGVGTPENVR